MRFAFVFVVACAILARTPASFANGRFPAAQHVLVGPGAASTSIVLRTTFGLMISRDSGASFRWVCEEAMNFVGDWDPPIALTADGRIHAGIPEAVNQSSTDDCTYAPSATLGMLYPADLANDPLGERVLGVEGNAGVANRVFVSTDRGRSFTFPGASVRGAFFTTADFAPSNPMVIYATSQAELTREPALYRSDDGGRSLSLVTRNFNGGSDAWISGIDPTNPDRIWVRSTFGEQTLILRSDDGGRTFRTMYTTMARASGFAMSDDGRRIWVGGLDDGLLHSDDMGEHFRAVSNTYVHCLRYHAGSLYICGNDALSGFALARWRDGAAALEPILRFRDVAAAFDCPAGTAEHDVCALRWPSLRQMFLYPSGDAGRDATVQDSGASADGGTMDAASTDGGTVVRPGGCGCTVARSARRGSVAVVVFVVVAVVAGRRGCRGCRRRRLGGRGRRGGPCGGRRCGDV